MAAEAGDAMLLSYASQEPAPHSGSPSLPLAFCAQDAIFDSGGNIVDIHLSAPLYTSASVARLAGVSKDRVRRWLRGYEYDLSGGPDTEQATRRRQAPVIRQEENREGAFASFLDLVDLLFVKQFLNHGVSLQKVRRALDEAEEIFGERHFAKRRFFTNGKNIFLDIKGQGRAILELCSGGQWVIPEIIVQLADQIEFDRKAEFALRWFPDWGRGKVVLDPKLAYGRPVLVGSAIPTSILYDQYLGEGKELAPVAAWFDLRSADVRVAIAFERRLAAAA